MHSRHHRRRHRHTRLHDLVIRSSPAGFLRASLCGGALLVAAHSSIAQGQRVDSARVAPRPAAIDTTRALPPQPPLSPRRAFLYSALLPGYAQSRLGRPTAGAIFVFTESIAIAMLRESALDLREARRFRTDSLVFIGFSPTDGTPVMQASPYNDELVSIRKGHVEDWIAFLIANHLFAGADAYVAAHLWDLPSQIVMTRTPSGSTVVAARMRF
jgi:hypothetical protein